MKANEIKIDKMVNYGDISIQKAKEDQHNL